MPNADHTSDEAALRLRGRALGGARRVVVKVGSSLLSESPAGRPAAIADEVASLRHERGLEIAIVSSGAIALGTRVLGQRERPRSLHHLQAAAAVGQNHLMQNWEHAFGAHRVPTGQILLTHDDLGHRARFLNARHALRALLDARVVPVINENDTVGVEEIKYGDNDLLAALVCNLISADALVVLTDVDGLYDGDPRDGSERVPIVRDVDRDAGRAAAPADPGGVGSGGMASKVKAAKAAARHGVATAVVPGRKPGVIAATLRGEDLGTLFTPSADRISSRKHWIAYSRRPTAKIVVDEGARRAVAAEGRSLLPAGVVEVVGEFELGDIVSLVDRERSEFARGLAAYSDADVRRIRGLHSAEIEPTLGYKYLDAVVHRDDLVVL